MKPTMKMVITQIKSPYFAWECFQNGMFKTLSEIDNYSFLFNKSIELLSNQELFYKTGILVIKNWEVSCDNFLTNKNINKIAFIGQVCCCYAFGVPEIVTKDAWKVLDTEIQTQANNTALKILKTYEAKRKKIHCQMEEIWI